jgi:hypothetical protein
MSVDKKAYFQGGGGENKPEPKKKKYKSDPAIVVQPRFKEPFYRNYDLYNVPGEHGPGAGYHDMEKYKSISEFLKAKRKKLKDKYKADDSWIMDDNSKSKKNPDRKARMAIFESIIKNADHMMPPKEHGTGIYDWKNSLYQNVHKYKSVDEYQKKHKAKYHADDNDIDFPIDDMINHDEMIYPIEDEYEIRREKGDRYVFPSDGSSLDPENLNISMTSPQIAGEHSYLPEADFAGRSDEALNFGRDYDNEAELPNNEKLNDLEDKYLEPSETDLFGLPDGIDPNSDLDAEETQETEEPYTGTSDIGTQIYEDKWNI